MKWAPNRLSDARCTINPFQSKEYVKEFADAFDRFDQCHQMHRQKVQEQKCERFDFSDFEQENQTAIEELKKSMQPILLDSKARKHFLKMYNEAARILQSMNWDPALTVNGKILPETIDVSGMGIGQLVLAGLKNTIVEGSLEKHRVDQKLLAQKLLDGAPNLLYFLAKVPSLAQSLYFKTDDNSKIHYSILSSEFMQYLFVKPTSYKLDEPKRESARKFFGATDLQMKGMMHCYMRNTNLASHAASVAIKPLSKMTMVTLVPGVTPLILVAAITPIAGPCVAGAVASFMPPGADTALYQFVLNTVTKQLLIPTCVLNPCWVKMKVDQIENSRAYKQLKKAPKEGSLDGTPLAQAQPIENDHQPCLLRPVTSAGEMLRKDTDETLAPLANLAGKVNKLQKITPSAVANSQRQKLGAMGKAARLVNEMVSRKEADSNRRGSLYRVGEKSCYENIRNSQTG